MTIYNQFTKSINRPQKYPHHTSGCYTHLGIIDLSHCGIGQRGGKAWYFYLLNIPCFTFKCFTLPFHIRHISHPYNKGPPLSAHHHLVPHTWTHALALVRLSPRQLLSEVYRSCGSWISHSIILGVMKQKVVTTFFCPHLLYFLNPPTPLSYRIEKSNTTEKSCC